MAHEFRWDDDDGGGGGVGAPADVCVVSHVCGCDRPKFFFPQNLSLTNRFKYVTYSKQHHNNQKQKNSAREKKRWTCITRTLLQPQFDEQDSNGMCESGI